MTQKEKDYLLQKRLNVLTAIEPICKAFKITDYDYLINPNGGQSEALKINDTLIGCTSNSISAIVDELIGYIFVTRYCRNRQIGAFQKQTLNVITQYWKREREQT